jgi:hypothetical protein
LKDKIIHSPVIEIPDEEKASSPPISPSKDVFAMFTAELDKPIDDEASFNEGQSSQPPLFEQPDDSI